MARAGSDLEERVASFRGLLKQRSSSSTGKRTYSRPASARSSMSESWTVENRRITESKFEMLKDRGTGALVSPEIDAKREHRPLCWGDIYFCYYIVFLFDDA